MKRIISFIVAALVILTAAVSVSSCNKESKASLAGTTWVMDAVIAQVTYKFVDDTKVQNITTAFGQTAVTIEGTYTYNAPTVTVTLSYQGQTVTATGTIDGDKLTMTEQGQKVVYTKQ